MSKGPPRPACHFECSEESPVRRAMDKGFFAALRMTAAPRLLFRIGHWSLVIDWSLGLGHWSSLRQPRVGVDLFFGVVAAADEGAGLDVAEAAGFAAPFPGGEFVGV